MKLAIDFQLGKPDHDFDPTTAPPAPDYSEAENWAALPDKDDFSDKLPLGITNPNKPGKAPVDVFFVHPTGYMKETVGSGIWIQVA